jgi:hypothetical protein
MSRMIPLFSKVHALTVSSFTSDALLDVRGRLEGEDILGAAIHCIPDLWCFEESLSESVFYLSAGAFT